MHELGATRGSVLRHLLANPSVRSLELAFSGFNMAEYGVWVSVLVYAYERGGVDRTAIVAVAQLLPAGILAPILARLVAHWGAARTLRAGYWLQSASLAATASLMLAGAPQLFVYGAAVVAATAVTMTRPAQAALVPALTQGAGELTAINVLSGWVEGASVLAGPALAGALIGLDGPGAAIGAFAVCTAGSALLVGGLAATNTATTDQGTATQATTVHGLRGQRRFTGLLALLGSQYLIIGMLDVLLVAFAISVLRIGAGGAGYLNAAFGAGGVLGSAVAISLIGRHRLVAPLLAAAGCWSLLLIALGAWPSVLGAFLLLAGAGITRSLLDVSGRTTLLDAAPPALRSQLFGVLEGVSMLALALGSLLVPILIHLGSARTALIAAGALLCAITAGAFVHVQGLGDLGADPRPAVVGAATRPERL